MAKDTLEQDHDNVVLTKAECNSFTPRDDQEEAVVAVFRILLNGIRQLEEGENGIEHEATV